MLSVLCFGDSNTFGFVPQKFTRYDKNTRWTGILSTLSAGKFKIIEAGCNNRTCFCDNPAGLMETGYKVLPNFLKDNPNIVIFALGINDLQTGYNTSLDNFKTGLKNTLNLIEQYSPNSKILLLAPSVLNKNILNGFFAQMFDEISIEKSTHLAKIYKQVANEQKCYFLDLKQVAKVSELDGLHYTPEGHKLIAQAIYTELKSITG